MPPKPSTATYTETAQALAVLVDRFKNDALPLEEALSLFEQGVGYVAHCQQLLSHSEGRLLELQTLLNSQRGDALAETTTD
jgi:exodeoxyribonuclease VII small subunit